MMLLLLIAMQCPNPSTNMIAGTFPMCVSSKEDRAVSQWFRGPRHGYFLISGDKKHPFLGCEVDKESYETIKPGSKFTCDWRWSNPYEEDQK